MRNIRLHTTLFVLVVVILLNSCLVMASDNTVEEILTDAESVFNEISIQEDASTMGYLLNKAKGVAIFPEVIKMGFMLGGRYGEGLLLRYDKENNSWYGPYFVEMKGISYGLQIGIQSIGLVLVITNEQGMESLKDNTITLGGDVSIAAGPVGRSAEAATDIELQAAIYSYSMTKGAFAGISLEGAELSKNDDANRSYWNDYVTAEEILKIKAEDKRIRSLITSIDKLMNSVETE